MDTRSIVVLEFELATREESLARLDRGSIGFAAALAAVAGYVDAAGFLMTGGYFVSFMSGNSTRLGVGLALGIQEVALAASLIGAFVGGVMAGASVRRLLPRRPETIILAGLASAVALSAYLLESERDLPAAVLLAAAMGAENTIFAGAGEVRLGLTYMTGALVKVGKGLTAALFREARLRWAPHLLLWLGLVCGAVLGAAAFSQFHALALWPAVAALGILALLSPRIFALEPPQDLGGPTPDT